MVTITFHIKNRKKQVKDFCKELSDYFNYCDLFLHNEDENGNYLPNDEWVLSTCSGTPILEGRDDIESETGILDIDGDYDTIIVKKLDDLYEEEIEILRDYYLNDGYTDCYCIDDILKVLGYREISNVYRYSSNADISFTDGSFLFIGRSEVEDMEEDEMREYITDKLKYYNVSPLHLDKIEKIMSAWA